MNKLTGLVLILMALLMLMIGVIISSVVVLTDAKPRHQCSNLSYNRSYIDDKTSSAEKQEAIDEATVY